MDQFPVKGTFVGNKITWPAQEESRITDNQYDVTQEHGLGVA